MKATPLVQIREVLDDQGLQTAIYGSTSRLMDKRRESIPSGIESDFQLWREQAHNVKRHTLDHLDWYLELLEANLTARGAKVIYARDGDEVVEFVSQLAQREQARLVVKSKSMTTEEIHLRERLEKERLEVVETDLGEYVIQLADERPSHIVTPAMHMTRFDIAYLLTKELGVEREEVPEKQTKIVRHIMREKFLAADIGITGANFLVAESGSVVIIENEGNARLTSTVPRVQVAVAGLEKMIPRAADLSIFLRLLGRSATGQPLTAYTSILSGPRREGEVDGPEEFYVVLLDNGRTKLLADRAKRESLFCIRCGACLNHCPVYRKIGGHNYPGAYSGPIGAIITPQYHGTGQAPWLPFASSLCGACGEVCPVKIDIPRILLELRHDEVQAKFRDNSTSLERIAFRIWSWVMRRPRLYELGGMVAALMAPRKGDGWIKNLPAPMRLGPLKAWLSQRDFPPPASRSFRQMWRDRTSKEAS